MRIIGGSAKGKSLNSPSDKTRPTSDRAREGLFSTLESEFGSIADLNFLDLFSGSGAVGVEALSRGANRVTSVEQHAPTAQIANKNFLLVNETNGVFEVVNADALKFVSAPSRVGFDIIFADPPYELSNTDVEKMLQNIVDNNLLKPNGLIAIERESKSKEFTWPSPLAPLKMRAYGQGSIYYGKNSDNFKP
jgi:16S rRNA (guanine966-N2)-methyltransferase